MKPRKKIPTFKDEDAEREFWANADSTEYVDWSQAQRIMLPNFRPTLRTISLRLPESMIAELKLLANQRDVPYQSLLKVFLAERINEERTGKSSPRTSTARKRAG
jgi:predicted DNA binding CopG/RHH family protein